MQRKRNTETDYNRVKHEKKPYFYMVDADNLVTGLRVGIL